MRLQGGTGEAHGKGQEVCKGVFKWHNEGWRACMERGTVWLREGVWGVHKECGVGQGGYVRVRHRSRRMRGYAQVTSVAEMKRDQG